MKDAELAKCAPGMPDALCGAAEQAKNFQGYVVADDMAAADSRDSFGTVDYTHKDSAGASVDPGAGNFMQPLAPDGTNDNAEEIEAQTAPIPISANMAIEPTPTPGTDNARQIQGPLDGTEKNGNPLASLQFIFRTSSGSMTRRFGAGNVAGRAAGVRAPRLRRIPS